MNILLTGATGFVGHALTERLRRDNRHPLTVVSRGEMDASEVRHVHIDRLDGSTQWGKALSDVEVVIHSAARVHVMNDQAADPLAEFRAVNVDGTLGLARQAAESGAKRFVFISSIKVNGEGTALAKPYTAEDKPAPLDPYGVSKWEAEEGLRALAKETGLEVVIIRPVLVYGPGVKANFRSMMSWLRKGVPLPLGAIQNKRSLVALDNLVDLITTCIDHPTAANQTFLVSDGEDLSTSELLRRMGKALDIPARLIPVPASLLQMGAALIGKGAVAQRLCGSLQVDITKTRDLLGWSPVVSVDQALRKTAETFKQTE